jgi:exodeoxyribonuclease VII large subunit
MSQLPLFQPPIWSVKDLTNYMKQLLESDSELQNIWVSGEISNCVRHGSGHLYFTLKDRTAALKCVMWRTNVIRQSFTPRDGDAVEVHGNINIYEASGQYQLYADQILPTGEGILYKEYLRLKARLEAEGLFAPERKRTVPEWPQRIGIVTSSTGAALRDMLQTIRRRYPVVEVILASTPVQGEEAPAGITAALKALEQAKPDVILLARGGGSMEDLQAFNDERVARAIAACLCPIICGVGHETDITVADFVADRRAATPTAAAELATPDQEELRQELFELTQRLKVSMRSCFAAPRMRLNELQKRLQMRSPVGRLRSDRQRLDELGHRAASAVGHTLELKQARLDGVAQRLKALNPLAILSRGYAIVTDEEGKLIRSKGQVAARDSLIVQVSDGKFGVQVKSRDNE